MSARLECISFGKSGGGEEGEAKSMNVLTSEGKNTRGAVCHIRSVAALVCEAD